MRLLTYDELPASSAPSSALTQLSAFGRPFLDRQVRVWRRAGGFAPYVGVFAVEGGQVIGQTYCWRFLYRYPDREAPVGGVAAVATRPDRTGRGIARRILEEVHRREREDGIEHVLLWTNRSWGAHRVYERLGYRDVHHVPFALRAFDADPVPRGPLTVRRARAGDVSAMETLHRETLRGRPGFSARRPGTLAAEVATEGPEALQSLWVAVDRRKVVGYAVLQENPGRVECGELLARSARVEEALLGHFRRRARRRWGVLDYTVAADRRARLRRDGYTFLDRAWFVLMGARSDGRAATTRARVRELGTDAPRWVCFVGDRF